MQTIEAKAARELILKGTAPNGMRVIGTLDLASTRITKLPEDLHVDKLDVSGCTYLRELPRRLQVRQLIAASCTSLRGLPDDIKAEYRLDLSECTALASLPTGLSVSTLNLRNCTGLLMLPEDLSVFFLDISGCTGLSAWPQAGWISYGRLNARGCTGLSYLPNWLTDIDEIDLRGCRGVRGLPDGLKISGWIDVADTRIEESSPVLNGVQLRWRGAPVDSRVIFHPETIVASEVLAEVNAERRRVLLERMGYEAFIAEVKADVLDQDTDPGGKRQLLRVPMGRDEPLVCVAVKCPSTGRQYVIRVPPTMKTCHQAAAWIAGFEQPGLYKPLKET